MLSCLIEDAADLLSMLPMLSLVDNLFCNLVFMNMIVHTFISLEYRKNI